MEPPGSDKLPSKRQRVRREDEESGEGEIPTTRHRDIRAKRKLKKGTVKKERKNGKGRTLQGWESTGAVSADVHHA